MSDPGPLGGNPFEGLPFFDDLLRLLGRGGQGGGMSWDAARQIAMQVATDGRSEPNVDPIERMQLEDLVRVADLHVSRATGLSTSVSGSVVRAVPVTRTQWAQRTLDEYRPLLERLATSLGAANEAALSEASRDLGDLDADDPEAAMTNWLSEVVRMLNPMMLAVTAGSMVGHLARRSLGQYDLPIPRPRADDLLLLVPNIDEFGNDWSLPRDDLTLWVCMHELTHHAVLGVPHVRTTLDDALTSYVSTFTADPTALESRLGHVEFDPTSPESFAELQRTLGDPDIVLGAIVSPEQHAMRPRLDALVSVIVGYVDHVMDRIGTGLISSYPMLTEALRRRRVEAADADRFVERLLGLELTQAIYDRGAAFADGVVQRAGEDALAQLWEHERNLPTPSEVDAPGLWLARLELHD